MSNEQYLLFSYIIIGVSCVLLAIVVYLFLRSSFNNMTKGAFSKRLTTIMSKVFPLNILLFSLAGFFSVSFSSCSKSTYESIIADRSYLVSKNLEQLETSLYFMAVALMLFGLLISVGLAIFRKKHK